MTQSTIGGFPCGVCWKTFTSSEAFHTHMCRYPYSHSSSDNIKPIREVVKSTSNLPGDSEGPIDIGEASGDIKGEAIDPKLGPQAPRERIFDPKQQCGEKKVGFDNIAPTTLLLVAQAMQSGADKYGPLNWLQLPDGSLKASTYLNAVLRHFILYKAGQDRTSDTDVHNIDAIIAGLTILRDAELQNKLHDDRVKLSPEQIKKLEQLINKEIKI